MAIIKCKMCGGDLNILDGVSVAECEYCGSRQTVPASDSEKKLIQFDRAERLRKNCEFDKAAGVYESIISEFPQEAEAFWGLVLCKYGIEYVDDPATGKKVPTCHRSSFESVMEDADFEQATENADVVARKVYRDEAKQIEEIRKGIIEVSGKEEPYDIFICYKETSEDGQRTIDSVIAQDVYDTLTAKGYRVFFSRITLEDKLGQEYEPYIFAALNSAKIMLVFGTDYEYYNAVWVKNEWSRFLKLMEKDKAKHLIPCYKGIDAYDIPKEFAKLQAQDMGKIGAVQDVLRGIEKLLSPQSRTDISVLQRPVDNVSTLLRRGTLLLEENNWNQAEKLFNQILNINPENGDAYLGLAMVTKKCASRDAWASRYADTTYEDDWNIRRAIQFASSDLELWFEALAKQRESVSQERFLVACRHIEEAEVLYRAEKLTDAQKAFADAAKIFESMSIQTEECKNKENYCRSRIVEIQNELNQIEADKNAAAEYERQQALLKKKQEFLNKRRKICCIQNRIHAYGCRTVALKPDGRVLAKGRDGDNANWFSEESLSAISVGLDHVVGLKGNGTVAIICRPKTNIDFGQCGTDTWRDIMAISAGGLHTVGLKANGTVVATGQNYLHQCDVSDWSDIVAISAGAFHTVGLKATGTVVLTGEEHLGKAEIEAWKDIVAISAGYEHTVGLKSDGTVVAQGRNKKRQCDVHNWKDIIAISAGDYCTIGINFDGTIVVAGENEHSNLAKWDNVVTISAGRVHTVGVREDGTVLTVGENNYGQRDLNGWRLFQHIDTAELEIAQATEKLQMRQAELECQRQRHIQELVYKQTCLQDELAKLRGLFTGKRRKEIENEMIEIQKLLDTL